MSGQTSRRSFLTGSVALGEAAALAPSAGVRAAVDASLHAAGNRLGPDAHTLRVSPNAANDVADAEVFVRALHAVLRG